MLSQGFHLRALFSVLTFLSFVILLLTGVGLFIAPPHDHAADWLSWSWMGMDQDVFSELHIMFGLLFFASAIVHIFYNFKSLLNCFKKSKSGTSLPAEAMIATVLSLMLNYWNTDWTSGPAYVIEWGEKIQGSWAVGYPEAPIPNTESLTIEQLANLIEAEQASGNSLLSERGFATTLVSTEQSHG